MTQSSQLKQTQKKIINNNENAIEFFNCTFQSSINWKLISQKNIQIIKKRDWNIIKNQYFISKWKQIFSKMIECKVQKLYLANNFIYGEQQACYILKDIQHIQFATLIILDLRDNFIKNIQSLQFVIQSQSFRRLDLKNNQISRITVLAKTKQLQIIQINNNPIKDLTSLLKMKFILKSSFIYIYLVDRTQSRKQRVLEEDLSKLVKLPFKAFIKKSLQSLKNNQIFQPKIVNFLQQKIA